MGGQELRGIPAFIKSCVYKAGPDDLISSADLKTAYLSYLDTSREDATRA
jgi:hypothetical protein